jgi:peptidoglycan/LPS O-acetylase OafA/YrhL
MLLASVSILFIVSLSQAISQKRIPFLAYVGTSSMAIYLMHILASSGSRIILNKVFDVQSVAAHLIIGCCLGIFLPMLVNKTIQTLKIPYVFSAPISQWITSFNAKVFKKNNRRT